MSTSDSGRSRHGYEIANVAEAGEEAKQTLEAQTEATRRKTHTATRMLSEQRDARPERCSSSMCSEWL